MMLRSLNTLAGRAARKRYSRDLNNSFLRLLDCSASILSPLARLHVPSTILCSCDHRSTHIMMCSGCILSLTALQLCTFKPVINNYFSIAHHNYQLRRLARLRFDNLGTGSLRHPWFNVWLCKKSFNLNFSHQECRHIISVSMLHLERILSAQNEGRLKLEGFNWKASGQRWAWRRLHYSVTQSFKFIYPTLLA